MARRGSYVPLQDNYQHDAAIIAARADAGNSAELAYIRSLTEAKRADNDGVLMWNQCAHVKQGIRRWNDVKCALIRHQLWLPLADGMGIQVRSWLKHNPSRAENDHALEQDAARKRAGRKRSTEAPKPTVSDRTFSASVIESRREESKGPDRTPSGPVRSGPAQPAPRSAGGAAQPAPSSDVVASEIAAAREKLKSASAKFKAKAKQPLTVGNGKDERVDFAATLARLTEFGEKLQASESNGQSEDDPDE